MVFLTTLLQFIELLLFILFLMLLTSSMKYMVQHHIVSEAMGVILIIGTVIVYIVELTMRILVKLNKKIIDIKTNNSSYLYIITGVVVLIIILPDLFYTYFVYGLYYAGYSDPPLFWDQLFLSFGLHFLIDPSTKGEHILKDMLSNHLGQGILTVHMIFIRIIDITVLGAVSSLFIQKVGKRIN